MSGLEAFANGTWLPLAVAATWKSSVLLLLAAGASVLMRRRSAALRHLLWLVALVGVIAVPLANGAGAKWSVTVAGWPTLPGEGARGARAALPPAPVSGIGTPAAAELAAAGRLHPENLGIDAPVGVARAASPVVAGHAAGTGRSARVAVESVPAGAAPASVTWPIVLLLLWLAGAVVGLLLIVSAIARVWLLERRAQPLRDERVVRRLEALKAEVGVTGCVRLLEARGAVMPMTWGVRHASILLPRQATEWHPSLLDAVLLHELAHVRRRDVLAQLVAGTACALHWFNPLIWWSADRLREESELACDDIGARGLSGRPEYAHELVELARSLRSERRLTVAAIALARRARLTGRVIALLDESRSHSALTRRQRWAVAITLALMALPISVLAPTARRDEVRAETVASGAGQAAPPSVSEPGVMLVPAPRIVARQSAARLEAVDTAASGDLVALAALQPKLSISQPSRVTAEALPAADFTAATPAREADDMRARAALNVLAALSMGAGAAQAQVPAHTTCTIVGTVRDSITGQAIKDALLTFSRAHRKVLTDALGQFVLRKAACNEETIVAEQLGYEAGSVSFRARDSLVRIDLKLNPDPVLLKGLTVVVHDYHRMLKRVSVGRIYERRDLVGSGIPGLGVFLMSTGALNPVRRPDQIPIRSQDIDSVWVHGVRQKLELWFDDELVTASFAGLPGYPLSEVYAVVVGPGGGSVRILTNWYIEYLARTGQRLPMPME